MPAPKKVFNPYGTLNKAYNALNKATSKALTGSSKNAALKKPYPKKVKPELKKPLTTPKSNVKVKDSTSRDPFAGMSKPMGPLTPKQQEAQRLRASQIRMDRMRAAEAKAKKNR